MDGGGHNQPTRPVHPHPSSIEAIRGPLPQVQGGTYQGLIYSGEELSGEEGYSCWRFRYDPFKRIPRKARALDFSMYSEEDFSL